MALESRVLSSAMNSWMVRSLVGYFCVVEPRGHSPAGSTLGSRRYASWKENPEQEPWWCRFWKYLIVERELRKETWDMTWWWCGIWSILVLIWRMESNLEKKIGEVREKEEIYSFIRWTLRTGKSESSRGNQHQGVLLSKISLCNLDPRIQGADSFVQAYPWNF